MPREFCPHCRSAHEPIDETRADDTIDVLLMIGVIFIAVFLVVIIALTGVIVFGGSGS